MASFELVRPASVGAALDALARPAARAIAGGTDLVPNLRHGLEASSLLVDLTSVDELHALALDDGALTLGACVTLSAIASDARIAAEFPALAHAAASVAAPAHRSAATVGGNLCLDTRCVHYNQSEWWRKANGYCLKYEGEVCHVAPHGAHCHAAYSGDLAPALLVLGAEVELAARGRSRTLPLHALYADDGAHHLTLDPGEIVVRVRIPRQPRGSRSAYRKARVRGAIDFPLAGVAARLTRQGSAAREIRVALTGTNSLPLLLDGTAALAGRPVDDALLAEIARLVRRQASPMRTTATAANYRRQVASVLAERLVRELSQAGSS